MAQEQDKSQFGLTKENNSVIERVDALKLFPNQAEAAKFAMAYAIREGAVPGSVAGVDTKWHTGGFDPQGEIAETIRVLFPECTTPYRAIEFLVNDGLERLSKHLSEKGTIDLLDLLPA